MMGSDVWAGEKARKETATFGAGCFWCVEAAFREKPGVRSVTAGYTGGVVKNPSYRDVCSGRTGHAEAVRVEFDPALVSYRELLDLFWTIHDPTSLNRQGADVGTQYRSVIFCHSDEQRRDAEASRDALEKTGTLNGPIVTEIRPAPEFFPAEDYHQQYFTKNPDAAYCRQVIRPKLEKIRAKNPGGARPGL